MNEGGKYNAVERRAQAKCVYDGDGKSSAAAASTPSASADQNVAPTHKAPVAKAEPSMP